MAKNLILGAGLAGLACSHHFGHGDSRLLERSGTPFGHIRAEFRDGFTWDEGPHVSFTKHAYVRDLFAASVGGEFDDYAVRTTNHYRGHWIDHPAQTALHQVPEPLRARCLESFLASRSAAAAAPPPAHYGQWLEHAFGPTFAETFPAAYTRKYWTVEPAQLTTAWVGGRVHLPKVEDVVAGSRGPLGRSTHYITRVRYPRRGGYQAFARGLASGARVTYGAEVVRIDLARREVWTSDGTGHRAERLISTLPLPVFIAACADAPAEVLEAARALACTSVLLVNVHAPVPTARPENWIYVYDEDKLSTRINCTEKLTPGNAPAGHTGIQVEVYFSRFRPLPAPPDEVGRRVVAELRAMGLLPAAVQAEFHTVCVPWANVLFTPETAPALDLIWSWLARFGLAREDDDLHPLTDWSHSPAHPPHPAPLVMAGRFAQWKYFWTDDCVLRGRILGDRYRR